MTTEQDMTDEFARLVGTWRLSLLQFHLIETNEIVEP